jgi:hypothetical protein
MAAELSRPTTYAGKLALAQRLVKSAQFRTDPKLAVRELCEAIGEIAAALLEREGVQQVGAGGEGHGKAPGP